MVSARQRSADFFVRYAIVEVDRQGVTGLLGSGLHIWHVTPWRSAPNDPVTHEKVERWRTLTIAGPSL